MAKYEVKSDNLILDGQNIDVKNIEVAVSSETAGTIVRGQVIDRHIDTVTVEEGDDTTTITNVVHAISGEANAIAAQNVEYEVGSASVVVPCYITGKYRKSELVTGVELTEDDEESLRLAGIILG